MPAVNISGFDEEDFFANPVEDKTGFTINGTLPTDNDQGVHSLTDVAVFAKGPCQDLFGGVYNSIDIFYGMAECLGLSRLTEESSYPSNNIDDYPAKFGYQYYDEQNPRYGGSDGYSSHSSVKKRNTHPL